MTSQAGGCSTASMFTKPIGDLTANDIQQLVRDGIRENRSLDYKRDLPGNAPKDKKEFLYDATSFANAAGGFLVFGIGDEKGPDGKSTGLPSIEGLKNFNEDQEVLRLEQLLRAGVQERVPGVQHMVITLPEGPVLVLHIPRSWSGPHMVTLDGDSRFYSRTSQGKYQLDLRQIRAAFLQSEAAGRRIQRFRDERLGRIVADEGAMALVEGAKLVLHLVPLEIGNERTTMDLEAWRSQRPPTFEGNNVSSRFNSDGLLSYDAMRERVAAGYAQVFRDGSVEVVGGQGRSDSREMEPWICELELVKTLAGYLSLYRTFAVDLPIVALASLVNVQGYGVPRAVLRDRGGEPEIRRDIVLFPDVLIASYDVDAPGVLRPVFDAMWQSFNFPKSLCYGSNGAWQAENFRWR